jgi:uncharacterized protein YaaQ
MKLMFAVVQNQDAGVLVAALAEEQFRVTRISSQGGFLREGNVTLMLIVEGELVDRVIQVVRDHCSTRTRYISPMPPVAESGEFYPPAPLEVQVGGATIFVVNADVAHI